MGEITPVAGVYLAHGAFVSFHIPFLQIENGDREAWRYVRDSLIDLADEISKNWLGEELVWIARPTEEVTGR